MALFLVDPEEAIVYAADETKLLQGVGEGSQTSSSWNKRTRVVAGKSSSPLLVVESNLTHHVRLYR